MLFFRLWHQPCRPSKAVSANPQQALTTPADYAGGLLPGGQQAAHLQEKGRAQASVVQELDGGPLDSAMHLRSGKGSFQLLFFRQESVQVGLQAALLGVAPRRHGLHFGAE